MSEKHDVEGLINSIRSGDLGGFDEILGSGFPVNSVTKEGNTALMYACRRGNVPAIEKLIAAGADVNHKNKFGKSAYDWAKWAEPSNVVRSFLGNYKN